MTARGLIVLALATACCGQAQHPTNGGEQCLSARDLLAAVAHLEQSMTELPQAKLSTRRLLLIYDDLVAAHRAEAMGTPPPALESGPCLPQILRLHVIFSGDEKPLEALASEPLFPTRPSRQNGLREVVGGFPATHLVEMVALPNVHNIDEPDPGRTALNRTRDPVKCGGVGRLRRVVSIGRAAPPPLRFWFE